MYSVNKENTVLQKWKVKKCFFYTETIFHPLLWLSIWNYTLFKRHILWSVSFTLIVWDFALTRFKECLSITGREKNRECCGTEEVIQKAFGTRWSLHCQNNECWLQESLWKYLFHKKYSSITILHYTRRRQCVLFLEMPIHPCVSFLQKSWLHFLYSKWKQKKYFSILW